jgi:CRP-like cAMP-binding protein
MTGQPAAKEGWEAVFSRRGWLASAPAHARDRILAAGRRIRVERGENVYALGSPPGGIYGVISGGIVAESAGPLHVPRRGHIFRAGHWFGHGPALGGGGRTIGVAAIDPSELLCVPLPVLRPLMQEDAEIARLVGAMASLGTNIAIGMAADLLIPEAPRRIAAVLLRLTGALEGVEPDDPRGFVLTQTDIGIMANVSRNHVNRVLADFATAGWITKRYSHVRIIDTPALSHFAYSEE